MGGYQPRDDLVVVSHIARASPSRVLMTDAVPHGRVDSYLGRICRTGSIRQTAPHLRLGKRRNPGAIDEADDLY
jgi:hypothetical protein